MAASVEGAAAVQPSPPASSEGVVEKARVLIGALNLVSRNLPLPPDLLSAVSAIYQNDEEEEEGGDDDPENCGALIKELEDAIQSYQIQNMPSRELKSLEERRFDSCIRHRLTELEALPSSRGEDTQMKCLLELYGLKLLGLQKKIRSIMREASISM